MLILVVTAVVLLLLALLAVVALIALAVSLVSLVVFGTLQSALAALAAVILLVVLYVLVFRVHRLPLGLLGLTHIPGTPVILSEIPATVVRLALRLKQLQVAKFGLFEVFTIGGRTTEGYTFMYGKGADAPATTLSLERPDDLSMSWTAVGNLRADSAALLPEWTKSVDPDVPANRAAANAQFWPTIATHGLAYNLVVLEQVSAARATHFRNEFPAGQWTAAMAQLQTQGRLYVIDTTILSVVELQSKKGVPRFTPATLTFLEQDAAARTFTPFLIRVAGHNGAGATYFDSASTDAAWFYALLAAKASLTVWGIWIGHVYHWHVVSAAMQMTMFKTLPRHHIMRQLLGRQSEYLIAFDESLLIGWPIIAPPTSLTRSVHFLRLMDAFAGGREFFDDDPRTTLARFGLVESDFSSGPGQSWDRYPVVRYLLKIWDATETYVGEIVDAAYAHDSDVVNDGPLQDWIAASGDAAGGNINGLPAMLTKLALKRVMTSVIYRLTAHGISRFPQATGGPGLTFTSNFPPCLQDAAIPSPNSQFDTRRLLAYLPRTGTLGEMAQFLFIFAYSTPYKTFIPLGGIEAELSFDGAFSAACNPALIRFRTAIRDFMLLYTREATTPGAPVNATPIHQWPLNIET